MIYGSVCSGIEAATQAWKPLGWTPAFFSEIEKFPSAVLAHHYESVPNYGDMTNFKEWPNHAKKSEKPIDILVGGTPCQSFSVAGLRAGLNDPRGDLMLTFGAIAKRYKPRWVVWENVPGVLSSNKGRDFGTLLGLLGQCGYGVAYRVLDAQYVRVDEFGLAVAQRRRRVFVVGCLRDWRSAAAVLFEPESLQGDPPSRKKAGQGVTGALDESLERGSDVVTNSGDTSYCLNAGGMGRQDGETETIIAQKRSEEVFCINGTTIGRQPKNGGNGIGINEGIADTLTSTDRHAVVYAVHAQDSRVVDVGDVCTTVTAKFGTGGGNVPIVLKNDWSVRRLMPIECERLQGFPDGFTQIPWRNALKEDCPDGHRYKALGNSMAVNCMRWLGRRIEMVENLQL